jgi:hypothetical protein
VTVRPLPAYEKSVFINCPFDSEYRDLLLANVFSVFAHGFVPRPRGKQRETPNRDFRVFWQRLRHPNTLFMICHALRAKGTRT